MPIDDVLSRVRHVEGWMTDGQATMLFGAARRVPAGGRIVEIGSFRGRSTIVLALGAAEGVEIIAIDPHAGNDRGPQEIDGFAAAAATDNEVFTANLRTAGVADRVRHLRMFSDAALGSLPGEVDMLYVDGAHRFAPARADIRDWGARVRDGGTMLVHDSFSSIGVTGAILAELALSPRFRYVGRSRSLTEFRADQRSGVPARAANASRLAASLPWFAWNLVQKVLITLRLSPLIGAVTRREPEWPY